MRFTVSMALLLISSVLTACIGGNNGTATNVIPPTPTVNLLAVSVDSGPVIPAPPGTAPTVAINHPYVTVKVCAPASQTQCATIDHVLVDTGSVGLRVVRSVLTAAAVTLSAETDANGRTIEECLHLGGGDTWGPVAPADVTMAGETAAKVPVQVLDDSVTSAPPSSACGVNGPLLTGVSGFDANGLLGVGVFAQDCGPACVNNPSAPLALYYGCTAAGACTAENVALNLQVTNPVTLFATDNNGLIVSMPNLVNANGDVSIQGQIIFGIDTQTDNALPATGLTLLGTDARGDFTAKYNGGTAVLKALIDSGTDTYAFDDPSIAVCSTPPSAPQWVGFYCPAAGLQSLSAVNAGVGANSNTNTVNFAIADPKTFVTGATAFNTLGGGRGSQTFTWGMPFFYGRKIYIGIDQKVSGSFTGPYFAY